MDILNERPSYMSFADYKNHLKRQKHFIAKRTELIWLSKEIPAPGFDFTKDVFVNNGAGAFVGDVKRDLIYKRIK